MTSTSIDISLVSMPFAEVQRPSIALGLLQSALKSTEIRGEVVYGNLDFAETIGLVSYQALLSTPTDHLLGEWCFARCLFPDFHADDETYLQLVLEVRSFGFAEAMDQRKEMVRWVRSQTVAYLDHLAKSILQRGPGIVGCSSVFQQHCASLALLKRIRELSPETVTLLGGANCEGEMGLETLRAFPWVDCIVSGEADMLFVDLCRVLLARGRDLDPQTLPYGAIAQSHLRRRKTMAVPRAMVRELDRLPVPDYDDYFEALRDSTLSGMIEPGLLAESSRGCWWGEKSHCTFCGLNGIGMAYRSKSPERVLAELAELCERYGIRSVQFVDNILDMSHVDSVLRRLSSAEKKYSLFYETKANLNRDQLRLLAEAGVRFIQPGIESLHDSVLKLIGKGNSALMNLQLLKWASEFGIQVSWNMLCGFPGESDCWYGEMAEWLPSIFHLNPPTGVVGVRYDRFSPYQMRPQEYGITLSPSLAYRYVYPLPKDVLMRLAYSFEDSDRPRHVHRSVQDEPGKCALQDVVRQWRDARLFSTPALHSYDYDEKILFVDTRPCAVAYRFTVSGLEKDVYRLCDTAQSTSSLLRRLSGRREAEVSSQELDAAVEVLSRAGVILPLNGKFLSIGVRRHTWGGLGVGCSKR